jgi:prevent-host-death family protein
MKTVSVHEAKTHLSRLLRRVAAGEEVVIAKSGRPVARLVSLSQSRARVLGSDRGAFRVPPDFDGPLPNDVLNAFEGWSPRGPLPVLHDHALRVAGRPPHHRDPFDRLLVAQCQAERLRLLTADTQFRPL